MSHERHQEQARRQTGPLRCAVVTVSDTRTEATDRSGALAQKRLQNAGHAVAAYQIVPDAPNRIRALLGELAGTVDAALLSGGTGLSARDRTFDALDALLEKKLPGFGELFRMLSYEEIGAGAMLSRATAGVYRGMLVFSMPGALNAVKLALDALILPELKHLAWEVVRQQDEA